MQSRQHAAQGRARREGLHRGRACRRSRAGMHGRQQRQGADWQGGTGRRARWAAAAWEDAHAGGKRERARAGGSLQVLSARNQGGSGVYIVVERGFLACVPREESGPDCWFGLKRFFLFFFLQKDFNKFDLNLNSTNSNSNQTTSNKKNAKLHECKQTTSFRFRKTTNFYLFLLNSLRTKEKC